MSFSYLIICAFLSLLSLIGFWGLFFFDEYVKKISALSVSYSCFLMLITLLSLKSEILSSILEIMVSAMVLFAANLLVGISIARNIANLALSKKNKL